MVKMNTDDEFHLYVGATRYYLGRMTYAVDEFVRTLVRNWSTLSEQTRSIICRDIEEQFELDDAARARDDQYKPLGWDCDRESWEKVRKLWR
jgi:hypothetical protein